MARCDVGFYSQALNLAGAGSIPARVTQAMQMGWRPTDSHKVGSLVRFQDLQWENVERTSARSTAGYANWKSDEVESLVILWVRRPPRSPDGEMTNDQAPMTKQGTMTEIVEGHT